MPGYNALPLELLAEEFAKLPGIGIKSAQRLAYSIISRPQEEVEAFANALLAAKRDIHYCPCCQNLTDLELCPICADNERDKTTVCVVEGPKDVSALERTGEYNGVYHVLHGLISPIDGITPDKLRIRELLARLNRGDIREVIMATNPTVEGDATAMYLAQLLEPLGVKVTRLAFGLPVGGTLEYADEVTLFKALENRTAM
ncbi:recombination mediator RecR [uncultured Ruminococcus sp.]|uniref:recombination mediator RecR n=1 Tax=uncultured Ruminococcus sp. TaxID=165186 RepID=UPI002607AB0D|nr:recombination mediator RecR [uncultured Ruminococcus sp.]